ncbi:hypothetical protein OEZ86_010198 [Tetradesmus obliquus]|nr:hypothetical protein OEZ86_010198 [Tetradesmus obliquus]
MAESADNALQQQQQQEFRAKGASSEDSNHSSAAADDDDSEDHEQSDEAASNTLRRQRRRTRAVRGIRQQQQQQRQQQERQRQQRQHWSAAEDERLLALVAQHGCHWPSVAAEMPGRDRRQCRGRYALHVTKTKQGGWTLTEDFRLASLHAQLGSSKSLKLVAPPPPQLPDSEPWSAAEQGKLLKLVAQHGHNWPAVAAKLRGRSSKQFRECYELHVAEQKQPHGRNWTAVAAKLRGRSSNQCRECYELHVAETKQLWTLTEDFRMASMHARLGNK